MAGADAPDSLCMPKMFNELYVSLVLKGVSLEPFVTLQGTFSSRGARATARNTAPATRSSSGEHISYLLVQAMR
jgi:hypothetical protein